MQGSSDPTPKTSCSPPQWRFTAAGKCFTDLQCWNKTEKGGNHQPEHPWCGCLEMLTAKSTSARVCCSALVSFLSRDPGQGWLCSSLTPASRVWGLFKDTAEASSKCIPAVQKTFRKSGEALGWWNRRLRDDSKSNKASFKTLKSYPNKKKRKEHNFYLIQCKHRVNQDKKSVRYNSLQTNNRL